MKSIFHKNLIHPGVFTHPQPTPPQPHQYDSPESQYTKSIEDQVSIIPITSELQYFERRLHLYKGYPSSLEPLADLHSIIVRCLHYNDDATDSGLIKYQVRTAAGRLLFFIKEQTDSFTRSIKYCAKPEGKVLNIMTAEDSTGIQFHLDFGFSGLCKKISTVQNSRELGSSLVVPLSLYPLSYRSFKAISHRQDKFQVVQKGRRIVDLCSPTSSHEFQVSFGRGGFSKGKIRKDYKESNSYTLCLFHGLDPVGKLILISSVILIDLQTSSTRKTTKKCNLWALILQFLISLLFYLIFLIISTLFLFMIFRLLLK